MRGYSVLFVCALCVFVLCGSAAVVAHGETPDKKAAEEVNNIAKAAKEKGQKALGDCKKFEGNVNDAVEKMDFAMRKVNDTKNAVKSLGEGTPDKEKILNVINGLEEKTKIAKTAVDELKEANAGKFRDEIQEKKLEEKMTEVDNKMKEVGSAAIAKAGELEIAAGAARDLWAGLVEKFTTQLNKVATAIAAVTNAKDDMNKAYMSFAGNEQYARAAKEALTDAENQMLALALENISGLQTKLQSLKTVAEEAKQQYDELVEKAKELQGRAGERSHREQNTGKGNKNEGSISTATSQPSAANSTLTGEPASEKADYYFSGSLCSLVLPLFVFCWCVFFGM